MAVSLREVVSFGRYEPLFRIAAGGMAEVYAARIRGEAGFQKLVAVKRMHPHLATDPGFVSMFLAEARLAAHIASPHVVQTLDLGRGRDGSLYIVMELVVGVSLAALQLDSGKPVPPPVAVEIVAQAAQGLDDAHEAITPAGDPLGLIHRDISPHNLLVGIDGRVRVTDWGIAHAIHSPRDASVEKELKGKFGYMSPEQTRLEPLDARTDVFSLGTVAWEMLVGRRLFADSVPAETVSNVRGGEISPPHTEAAGVPAVISRLVMRALARERRDRFEGAGAFARALREGGREAFGELPGRKRIGAFVREAGGDELERLRRLIRMGIEGAEESEIEAVKPGVTRVLSAKELRADTPATVGAPPASVLERTGSVRRGPPSVSVVALNREGVPYRTAEIDVLGHLEPIGAPDSLTDAPRSAPARSVPRGAWIVATSIVFAAAGIAAALLWPRTVAESLPVVPRATPTLPASRGVAPEPRRTPGEPRSAPDAGPRDALPTALPTTAPPEPPRRVDAGPLVAPRPRPPRRRARRRTVVSPQTDSSAPRELMGIEAFDRSRR